MAEGLPRHCERSEAIHGHAKHRDIDCFVACAPRNDDGGALPLRALAAPDRRHRHLFAAAGAAIDLLPGAELEILVHPNTPFPHPPLSPRPPHPTTPPSRIVLH